MEDTMPEYVGDVSVRYISRPEDVPNELEFNHSLMAQCEIDSLRSEILNLQDQRDLAMKVIKRLEGERDKAMEALKALYTQADIDEWMERLAARNQECEKLEAEREEWYRKAHENFKFTLDARDERDKAREALRQMWQSGDAFLPYIDKETTNRWRKAAGWEETK